MKNNFWCRVFFIKNIQYGKYTVYHFSFSYCFFLIILFSGCTNTEGGGFPRQYDLEMQRVCKQVLQRNTRKFMVEGKQIHALKVNRVNYPIPETVTVLDDGVYFCGVYRFHYQSCAVNQTQHLDGTSCRYSRQ